MQQQYNYLYFFTTTATTTTLEFFKDFQILMWENSITKYPWVNVLLDYLNLEWFQVVIIHIISSYAATFLDALA